MALLIVIFTVMKIIICVTTCVMLIISSNVVVGKETPPCSGLSCETPRIRTHPRNLTLNQGETGTLKCKAYGNPIPTIIWEKNGVRIDEKNKFYHISTNPIQGRNLVKSTLTVIPEEAVYACIASNNLNSVRSSDSYVTLYGNLIPRKMNNPSKNVHVDDVVTKERCIPLKNRTSYCSTYLNPSRSIYTDSGINQILLREKILGALSHYLGKYDTISENCAPFVGPFLCYYNFPYCSLANTLASTRPVKKMICRKDCVTLSKDYCSQELRRAKQDEVVKFIIPHDCLSLPTENCVSLHEEMMRLRNYNNDKEYVNVNEPKTSHVDPQDDCFFNRGELYRGMVNRSKSNTPCEHWSEENGQLGHNYCRNIGSKFDRPWCYVQTEVSEHPIQEVCNVRQCGTPVHSQQSNILYTIVPCLAFGLALSLAIIMIAWKRHKQHYYQSAPRSPKPFVPRVSSKVPELNREDLCDFRLLGDGVIGRVYTADFTGVRDGKTYTSCVAVKAIIEKASRKEMEDFVREAETRGTFQHGNVVSLVGVISKEGPLSLVYESSELGDLHEYLLQHSPNFSEAHAVQDNRQLEYVDLVVIATQIADGMAYLSSQYFIHRDLAARNCLIAEKGVIKISDFSGLKDLYAGDYYRAPGSPPLPVRWMSPEALSSCCFTTASDVWSFGVVLWEIFSYGSRPLFGLSNYQAMKVVMEHNLSLPQPDNCCNKIFSLMQDCWTRDPATRPTFDEIHTMLKEMNHISNLNNNLNRQDLLLPAVREDMPNSTDFLDRDVAASAFPPGSPYSNSQPHSLHSECLSATSDISIHQLDSNHDKSYHQLDSNHDKSYHQLDLNHEKLYHQLDSNHDKSYHQLDLNHDKSYPITTSPVILPPSNPSSISMSQLTSQNEHYHKNDHYIFPSSEDQTDSHFQPDSHFPLSFDNRCSRGSSVNSKDRSHSPLLQSDSCRPQESYVSSLHSYTTSSGVPPSMFRGNNNNNQHISSRNESRNESNCGHVSMRRQSNAASSHVYL